MIPGMPAVHALRILPVLTVLTFTTKLPKLTSPIACVFRTVYMPKSSDGLDFRSISQLLRNGPKTISVIRRWMDFQSVRKKTQPAKVTLPAVAWDHLSRAQMNLHGINGGQENGPNLLVF